MDTNRTFDSPRRLAGVAVPNAPDCANAKAPKFGRAPPYALASAPGAAKPRPNCGRIPGLAAAKPLTVR